MNVMALDLELNQPSKNIIQVGIVIGNIYTGAVLEKKDWIIYVDKAVDPIDPFITKLTTITQEMVDNGGLLVDAYKEIVELYKKHNCTLNMVTWGGGDHRELREALEKECKALGVEKPAWEFGHREYDVKTLFLGFAMAAQKKVRSGLAKSMTRIGMAFKGTKHWAPDDAENTFHLLVRLLKWLPIDVILK